MTEIGITRKRETNILAIGNDLILQILNPVANIRMPPQAEKSANIVFEISG